MNGLGAFAVVLKKPSTSDPVLRNDEVSGCEHATRFFDDRSQESSSLLNCLFVGLQTPVVCGGLRLAKGGTCATLTSRAGRN